MMGVTTPSMAQMQRVLPANGKLGDLVGQHQFPLVELDRKLLRLSPGGVIIDQNNRSILHAHLPAQAPVVYVLDNQGQVTRIILLKPEELARLQQARSR